MSNKKILIVEPDQLMAQTYRQFLRQSGYEVEWQQTAQAGIHALDQESVDLVVLELNIAGHNGIEFLYEMRSYPDWQNLPVILFTHAKPSIMNNQILSQKIKIAHYLYKPASQIADLLIAINRVLKQA